MRFKFYNITKGKRGGKIENRPTNKGKTKRIENERG